MNELLRYMIEEMGVYRKITKMISDKDLQPGNGHYDVAKFLKSAHENRNALELDYPICVPSCNNRQPSCLQQFQYITSPIYLFIYERQKHLYEYITQKNVTKVLVPDEYLTIQKMRRYMQEYMGDQIYWMLDDDIYLAHMLRGRVHLWWYQGLYILGKICEERKLMDKFCVASCQGNTAEAFYKGTERIGQILDCNAAQMYLLNGKLMRENELYFTGDPCVNEDIELNVNMRLKNLHVLVLAGVSMSYSNECGSKISTASTPAKVKQYTINNYRKFGEWVKIKYTSDGGDAPVCVPRRKPVVKDPIIERFLKYQDFNGLRKYIKQQNKKKNAR